MVAADEYDDELRRIAHYERGVAASLSPPPALPGNGGGGGGGGGPEQASLEALNNQLDGLLSMNHTTQASNSVPPPEAKPADDMQTLLGSLLGALKTDPGAVLQSEHLQPVPPQLLEAMAQAQANGSAAAAAAAAAAEVDGGGGHRARAATICCRRGECAGADVGAALCLDGGARLPATAR
eukprot:SAG25_NODE_119_length_14756_cov_696.499898_2_plen_181_part_00